MPIRTASIRRTLEFSTYSRWGDFFSSETIESTPTIVPDYLHDLAFKHKNNPFLAFVWRNIPLPRPQIWRMTVEKLISHHPCALFRPSRNCFSLPALVYLQVFLHTGHAQPENKGGWTFYLALRRKKTTIPPIGKWVL
jgi:hypothetical protein